MSVPATNVLQWLENGPGTLGFTTVSKHRVFLLIATLREVQIKKADLELLRSDGCACSGVDNQVTSECQEHADIRKERDRYAEALDKIDAIRNSIIGTQQLNWSAHAYPLVAALGEAGYGSDYEKAKAESDELFRQRDKAEAERDALKAELERVRAVALELASEEEIHQRLEAMK